MARLSHDQWESLEADYHTGTYSKNELAKKYNVSHTAVNKRLKDIEPKHADKVSVISAMKAELATESFKEVSAVETAIEKRTKYMLMFENSAIKNQVKADKLLDEADKLQDVESHSRITQRNKETVLGKDKTTEVNTNVQQNNETKVIKVEYS